MQVATRWYCKKCITDATRIANQEKTLEKQIRKKADRLNYRGDHKVLGMVYSVD